MCGGSPDTSAAEGSVTVSGYLLLRLKQLSVHHVFGIPGDYVLPFFDQLLDGNHGVEHVMPCNELNGTYAADGYAKRNGYGAMAVTFGPGSLSCTNAVAGAYADDVPLLVLAGAPAVPVLAHTTDRLLHHVIGTDFDTNLRVFEPITVRSDRLMKAEDAAALIDSILELSFRKKKPAYLEIPFDLQCAPIDPPRSPLILNPSTLDTQLHRAINCTVELLGKAKTRAVVAGHLVLRRGMSETLRDLTIQLGANCATTFSCKDGNLEGSEQAAGIYCGAMSTEFLKKAIEGEDSSHVILAVGMTNNEFDTGVFTSKLDRHNLVQISSEHVVINDERYDAVYLADFLQTLRTACTSIPAAEYVRTHGPRFVYDRCNAIKPTHDALTIDRMMLCFAHYFQTGDIIFGDAGGMINTSQVGLPIGSIAFGNGNWASIGAGFGCLVGASFTNLSGRRLIGMLGDGAFQMSAQDVSTLLKYRRNAALFVLNNAGYAAERAIHPGKHRSYNDIQNWKYHMLGEAFGAKLGACRGFEVHTEQDLADTLEALAEIQGVNIVNIHLDPDDMASFNKSFSEKLKH